MTTTTATSSHVERKEAFSGRLFTAGLEALELVSLEVGQRLGLYAALDERGPLTAPALAAGAGIAPRYAQEWLEQQAVTGVLEVDDVAAAADQRRYSLPAAHRAVLLDPDDPANLSAMAGFLVEAGRLVPALVDAFRTGGGVPYEDYAIHDVQAAFTRPVFGTSLVQEWLPALPAVQAKLVGGEPTHIVEIGCGEGIAAVTIAQAYPNATVHGVDLDEASVAAARKHAADTGVGDRVRFELWDACRGAAAAPVTGDADLVMAIEMLHDVPDPVGILSTMRELRGAGGTVLVVDERVADSFTAPGDEMERFMYAASVLHCLPVGMVDEGSAATGTVIRTSTVRDHAAHAGFTAVEVLPVEHDQFRLYELRG